MGNLGTVYLLTPDDMTLVSDALQGAKPSSRKQEYYPRNLLSIIRPVQRIRAAIDLATLGPYPPMDTA
jgi:hypothetical protein